MKLSQAIKAAFQEAGREGGKARAANMTPQQRKAAAKKAAKARWDKYRREKGNG